MLVIFLKLRKCRRRTLEESGDCNILGSNKSRQRPHESYMEISLMDRTPSRSSVCPSVPGQPPSASCSLSFRQALTTCELRNPKYEVRRWHTSDHSGGRRGVREIMFNTNVLNLCIATRLLDTMDQANFFLLSGFESRCDNNQIIVQVSGHSGSLDTGPSTSSFSLKSRADLA